MKAIGILVGFAMIAAGALIPGLGTGFILAGIGMVLSSVMGLLKPKPSDPAAQPDPGTQLTVRQAAAPHQAVLGRRRVSGVYAFIHSTSTAPGDATPISNQYLHLVIVWAGHEVDAIEEIWFNDEVVPFAAGTGVPTGRFQNYAWAWHHTGTSDQAADPELVASAPSYWTADHRLRGRAYSYIRLKWNRDIYTGGLPNITAVLRGYNQVYDPRDDSTGYSANAALCAAAYLMAPFGLGADYTELDEDDLIESANVCDEDVDKAAGGTEKRYEAHFAWSLDRARGGVLQSLLTAMRGEMVFSGGVYRLLAGAWRTSVLDLGDADLRGGFQVQTLLSRRDSFNGVKGTFASEADNWQPVDFPPVASATYLAQDGERVWKDVKFEATVSSSACQRLAKIDLLAARQPMTLTGVPFMLKALTARAGDNVTFTHDRFGWSTKAFHVTDLTLALGALTERGPPLVGVDLSLRETASTDFDWSTSEESSQDPAPNTNLPDTLNPLAPGDFTVGEEIYVARDGGGAKARALLAWAASPDAFVRSGGYYLAEYKLEDAADWNALPTTTGLTATVDDITPGIYNFRVTAFNVAGVGSDPVLVNRALAGLSAPPTEPQNFTITAIGGLAVLEWDPSTEIDVREGGIFAVRHSQAMSGATWATATSIGKAIDGKQHGTVLPLVPGTYLVKTQDCSGVWSETWAAAVTQQAGLLTFSSLASISEHPTFAGTKTDCVVVSNALQLTGTGLFSTVPLVSALPSFSYIDNAVEAAGSYAFANSIDLGSVKKVRLTGLISSLVFSALDKMSAWPLVSERARWGGTVSGNEADARLWMRKTDDNPAGAPTWTSWQRLDSAEHLARAFQFRLELESGDENYNIAVSSVAVAVEEAV